MNYAVPGSRRFTSVAGMDDPQAKEGAMRKMEMVDRERYEILRKMLEDRAREITDKLRSLRESLPDELAEVKDPEEQCVHEYARGLDFALIEMKSRTLEHINEALLRLEEGTYGACADCDQPIVKARLQALPFAERCRDCEEAREELAAETARQQSRFGVAPAEPDGEMLPAARRPGRPARRPAERPTTRPSARLARPGQLQLRRQVAAIERASSRREIAVPPSPSPTVSAPAAAAVRKSAPGTTDAPARPRPGRPTKHA
jgi:DnaK suppressor protein